MSTQSPENTQPKKVDESLDSSDLVTGSRERHDELPRGKEEEEDNEFEEDTKGISRFRVHSFLDSPDFARIKRQQRMEVGYRGLSDVEYSDDEETDDEFEVSQELRMRLSPSSSTMRELWWAGSPHIPKSG